jgi:hypothetical protein
MINKFKPSPGPMADLLRTLQAGGGWSALVTPAMKQNAVNRLVSIIGDDESAAASQIAAVNCLMRASDLDRANVEATAKLIEITELAGRLERIESAMAGESEDDHFIEVTVDDPESAF